MNAYQYASHMVMRSIPRPILKRAFQPENTFELFPVSLEQAIIDQVIRHQVMVDINMVTGEHQYISLSDAETKEVNAYQHVFHIPNTTLGGRRLNNVYEVGYLPNFSGSFSLPDAGGFSAGCNQSDMNDLLQKNINTLTPSFIPLSTSARLLSAETILAELSSSSPIANVARVSLAHDEGLNNMPPKTYPLFAHLCVLACKYHIYNHLILEMDAGFILHGAEYPSIKNMVEGYSDSMEIYLDDLQNRWRGAVAVSDRHRHSNHIRSLVPGNI